MEVPWDKYNPPHFYPTIDHILPIDLGGKDTPPNVQAAHWVCNVEKGNGLHEVHNPHGEQLRLVG
jgi:5-methylcytosine-specific restriction endonuclease McrA